MSKFSDLLNRPLPSNEDAENITESAEEKEPMEVPEPEDNTEDLKQEDGDDDDDDDIDDEVTQLATNAIDDNDEDDDNISDLSDEELAQLDQELTGGIDDAETEEIPLDNPVAVLFQLSYYNSDGSEISVIVCNNGEVTFMNLGLPHEVRYLTDSELSNLIEVMSTQAE